MEDQVRDLLHEADKTAAENKDQGQVYDAMAETLGDAWDSLVIVLEKRRTLLKLTSDFFENAMEVCVQNSMLLFLMKSASKNILFLVSSIH